MAFALARAGAARLVIANRTEAKARALAARVARAFPGVAVAAGPADPRGHDLIANGTALGMRPDERDRVTGLVATLQATLGPKGGFT